MRTRTIVENSTNRDVCGVMIMVNDINEFCWLPESDAWLFSSGLEVQLQTVRDFMQAHPDQDDSE
jgi:hypothetical protein